MGVRRTTEDKTLGYGVDGILTVEAPQSVLFNIADIAQNIPYPTFDVDEENNDPVDKVLLYVQWRVKIVANEIDYRYVQIYNGITGKMKLGDYVCKSRQYVVDDGFVSYDRFVSKLYCCVFLVNLPNAVEDELPCDEPPIDLGVGPVIRQQWAPQTSAYNGTSDSNVVLEPGLRSAEMGDSFQYFPPALGLNYGAGITYNYGMKVYDAAEYLNNDPVTILL